MTAKAQKALQTAIDLAQESGNPQLTPVHLALALFEDPEGIGKQAVLRVGSEDAYKSVLRVGSRSDGKHASQQATVDDRGLPCQSPNKFPQS